MTTLACVTRTLTAIYPADNIKANIEFPTSAHTNSLCLGNNCIFTYGMYVAGDVMLIKKLGWKITINHVQNFTLDVTIHFKDGTEKQYKRMPNNFITNNQENIAYEHKRDRKEWEAENEARVVEQAIKRATAKKAKALERKKAKVLKLQAEIDAEMATEL